jgi:hypothetical protein
MDPLAVREHAIPVLDTACVFGPGISHAAGSCYVRPSRSRAIAT